jgi:hypothetical protein
MAPALLMGFFTLDVVQTTSFIHYWIAAGLFFACFRAIGGWYMGCSSTVVPT